MSPIDLDLEHGLFQITARLQPPLLHLQVCGELDFSCARLVEAVHADVSRVRVVEVDLTQLSFVDTAGTGALLRLRQHYLSDGREVRFVHAQRLVRRVFTLLGQGHHLAV
jgi:anti-anti-sigma factor